MKGVLKMNDTRRKQIQAIIDKLEDLKSEVEMLKDEEQEALTIREALEKAEEEIRNLALLGNWQFWKIWDVGMCNDNIW